MSRDPRSPKAPDSALPTGLLFAGRYRIERRIGVGGMGAVYAVRDEKEQRRVALKVIAPQHMREPRQVQRFRREAQVASKLKHPNVVQVFDVGAADGREYLTMELLEGVDLWDAIQLNGTYEPAHAITILDQMLDALGAAHAAGLVHRDLKPENVYLAQSEDGEIRVRLLDFGVVKVPEEGAQTHLTRTGTVVGTPEYMAPEQATASAVDGRADLYSVGCIAYAMLTGRPPFQNKSLLLVMQAHVVEKPRPVSELRPKVPQPHAVDAFVMKALAKKPEDRYRDAADMRRALGELGRLLGAGAHGRITLPPQQARPDDLTLTARDRAAPPGGLDPLAQTSLDPPLPPRAAKAGEPKPAAAPPVEAQPAAVQPATAVPVSRPLPLGMRAAAFALGALLATVVTYLIVRR